MKRIFYLSIFFLMLSAASSAQTMYVSDNVDIDVRTGQGTQYRIIALIRPWDELEVLENGEEGWTHVKLANGKDGWMLTRFLTSEKPPRPQLYSLQKKYQQLSEEYKRLQSENSELKNENRGLNENLQQTEQSLDKTINSFDKLKDDSSEFLEVRNKLEATNKELMDLTNKYNQLEETASKIRNNQIIKGLLIGVGVLLVGFLMGLFSKRKQRRSSLL